MIRTHWISILGLTGLLVAPGCGSSSDHGAHEHGHKEHKDHKDHRDHETHGAHEDGVVELTPEAASRAHIRVAPVEQRPVSAVLTTTGRVDFDEDRLAHVSPRVPGRVHKVHAVLGQTVRRGQPLAVIDSIELGQAKSEYLRARAQLDLTRQTLRREEGLLADRITTEQAVLEARTAHQRALAAYQMAGERLRLLGLSSQQSKAVRYRDPAASLLPVRAPIDGKVVQKHVSLGEMVTPERNLYTIADLGRVWIWIDVYERDLARVHLEDDVEVSVDAYPEQVFHGKVAYIRDQIDPDTRTARARIDVDNSEDRLKPGMFASVTLTDPHGPHGPRQGLVVPTSAVQRHGDTSIVFVPVGERRYQRRAVTLGRRAGTHVEVLDGLSPGASVVVEGAFLLKSEAAKHRMGGGHHH